MTAETSKPSGRGRDPGIPEQAGNDVAATVKLPAAHLPAQPKVTIRTAPPEARNKPPALDPNKPDNLMKIRRINRELAEKLHRLGITHFDQIAEWTATDVRSLSAALGLGNEIYKQAWIEQAAGFALCRQAAVLNSSNASNPPQPSEPKKALRGTDALVAEAAASIYSRQLFAVAIGSIATEAGHNGETDEGPKKTAVAKPFNQVTAPDPTEVAARTALAVAAIRHGIPSVEPVIPKSAGPSSSRLSSGAEIAAPVPAPPAPGALKAPVAAAPEPAPDHPPSVDHQPPASIEEPVAPDDFSLICDMPEFVADRLNQLGITRFNEIAEFDADDVATLSIDCELGDQVCRECWLEQAAALSMGYTTQAATRRLLGDFDCLVEYPGAPLTCDPSLLRDFDARHKSKPSPIRRPHEPATPVSPVPLPPSPVTAIVPPQGTVPPEPDIQPALQPEPPVPVAPSPQPVKPPPQRAPAPPEPAALLAPSIPEDPGGTEETTASPVDQPWTGDPIAEPVVEEEAEVMITPRARSGTDQPETAREAATKEAAVQDGPVGHDAGPMAPVASKDRSPEPAGDPQELEVETFAGYHPDAEEASVEIIRSRPAKKQSIPVPEQPSLPASQPAPPTPRQPDSPASRFLKALRGH